MRFLFRNVHIFVFASLSASAAVWIASNPQKAAELAQPLIDDAVELQSMTIKAYREVRDLDLRDAADEAVSYYVAALRMPSLLFERLADQLDDVDDTLERRTQAEPVPRKVVPIGHGRPVPVRSVPHPHSRSDDRPLVSVPI
ncbi:hypothetical protein V1T76_10400 [Roseibium sp. FZY0029]|uniref:hypothetical protein n=1 Tax=Roseibium sp. FZY0029 TaxID=3116647 RepID=UPI002E9F1CE2|nr:hypothetical protein [Roseibium sp. FZY0029]